MAGSLVMPVLFSLTVFTFSFEISQIPVQLTLDSSILFDLYRDYFRYYRPVVSASPDTHNRLAFRLKLKSPLPSVEPIIPSGAELLSKIGVIEFWRARIHRRQYFFFKTNVTLFRVNPEQGRVVGWIFEEALKSPNLLANTYTFAALLLLLRWRGIYHLHTAASISPQKNLLLICGAQRAGKSTLATALGISGWHTISDDGVLLQSDEQGRARWQAFKRDFHLAAELLTGWESLRNIKSRHNYYDRACLDGLDLFDAKNLADGYFSQIDRVVFPSITNLPESRLEPISPSEAIRLLITQSMFFPLWPEHTQRQLQMLTSLLKPTRFYRLQAGTDLWKNPLIAGRLLDF